MAGFLRSLFSRGAKAEEPPRDEPSVEYNGYTITPIPVNKSRQGLSQGALAGSLRWCH